MKRLTVPGVRFDPDAEHGAGAARRRRARPAGGTREDGRLLGDLTLEQMELARRRRESTGTNSSPVAATFPVPLRVEVILSEVKPPRSPPRACHWNGSRPPPRGSARSPPRPVFRRTAEPAGLQDETDPDSPPTTPARQARGHRQDRAGPGHHRGQGHQGRAAGARRHAPGGALLLRSACPRVDHPGDEPPAAALLPRQLRSNGPRRSRRSSTPPSSGSSRSPTRTATTTPSPQGNRLWRKNLRDNNGDGQITPGDGVDLEPQLPDQVGIRQRGLVAGLASETYRGTGAGVRAGDPGAGRPDAAASASSSWSTTTRRPSCCSTASAGRSPRRPPTT